MDQSRFDDLTRRLGAASTRRAGLKAALGGLLGVGMGIAALPATQGEAKKKKKRSAACGAPCPSGQECQAGQCGCARPICGGACCGGNQTCIDGQCQVTGLRDCGSPTLVDGGDYSFCNLKGKSFSNRALRNANFEGADLSAARFTGEFQPWNCNFTGARMVSASLHGCDVKPGTTFQDATLDWAAITKGHIDGANFSGASLANADLYDTRVANTRFAGADLTGANLIKARFDRCAFPRAVLDGADLFISTSTNCDMSGASLKRTELIGADLQDTTLDDASLAGAVIGWASTQNRDPYRTKFTRCSMRGADMTGQTYKAYGDRPGVTFVDVDLARATFGAPYPKGLVAWLRTTMTGATGWQEPAGGYTYRCSASLPSGEQVPDTTWYEIDWGTLWDSVDPVPCSQAPAPGAPVA